MNMKNFQEGLAILAAYQEKPDGYWGGAEHDQFYAYATKRHIAPEDCEKLVALGWFQEEAEHEGSEEFEAKHYDPAESWTAYF